MKLLTYLHIRSGVVVVVVFVVCEVEEGQTLFGERQPDQIVGSGQERHLDVTYSAHPYRLPSHEHFICVK